MIEVINEDLVKEQGRQTFVYKRKHNISNDPNERKRINEDKKKIILK